MALAGITEDLFLRQHFQVKVEPLRKKKKKKAFQGKLIGDNDEKKAAGLDFLERQQERFRAILPQSFLLLS